MEAPGLLAGFTNEIHAAPGHVRCFGILIFDAGGLSGMSHRPSRCENVAVSRRCIRPVVPGILSSISFCVEVEIVGNWYRIVAAIRPLRMHAVVAFIGLESTFRDASADDRVRIHTATFLPLLVGPHVCFAYK